MKVEIERKVIRIIVGHRGRPEVRESSKVAAYCFQWRGYELGVIYVPDPSTGYCGLVLVKTGCGLMDPVSVLNPVEMIFNFLSLRSELHDSIESMCKTALASEITAQNTHPFDALAAREKVVRN